VVQECMGLTRGQGNSHPALRHFAEWPLQILAACAPCKAAQLLYCCSLSHAEYVLVKVTCLILLFTTLQLAGHTAELRFCMHTIASIPAKQTISVAKHPARPVCIAVRTCCVTAAAGWATIPTQGPEHLHGAEVPAPKNWGTDILHAVKLCLTVVGPIYAIASEPYMMLHASPSLGKLQIDFAATRNLQHCRCLHWAQYVFCGVVRDTAARLMVRRNSCVATSFS